MVFNFFKFKNSHVVEDVEAKQPELTQPAPMSFEEALAAQKAAKEVTLEAALEATPQSPAGQLDQIEMTREDVIAAFKIFLGRQPESEEVLKPWVGSKPQSLLVSFLRCSEFLDNPIKSQLVLVLAKKILDERKEVALSAESSAT